LNPTTHVSVHTHVPLICGNYSSKPTFILTFIFFMKPVFFYSLHTLNLGIVMPATIST